LGRTLSREEKKCEKLTKLLQITEIMNQVLKPTEFRKQTGLQIYSALAVPTLLRGSGTRDTKRTRQIQNHSSRDEIVEKNPKTHALAPQKHHDIVTQPVLEKKKLVTTSTSVYIMLVE
jgi:hypothetical protein